MTTKSLLTTDIAYSQENRRNRYRYMNAIRKITKNKDVRNCGLATLGNIQIRKKNSSAFYTGIAHCGRIWLCPNCAARVGVKRAEDVAFVLQKHREAGGTALFLTFTIRHSRDHSLEEMLKVIQAANGVFFRHRTWKEWKQKFGYVGHIRSFEITPGGTTGSAHPHIHLIILLNKPKNLNLEETIETQESLNKIWHRFVSRENPEMAPEITSGVRIDFANLDDDSQLAWYATKTACESTAGELVRFDRKNTYGSYWNVAIEASRGNKQAYAMWHEYEEMTFNFRKLTWSRGLRATYGLTKEKTDEELADEEEVNGELVVELDDNDAKLVRSTAEIVKIRILEMAELYGAEGVYWFLDRIRGAMMPLDTEEHAEKWFKVCGPLLEFRKAVLC